MAKRKATHKAAISWGSWQSLSSAMTAPICCAGSLAIEPVNRDHSLRKNVKKTIFLFSYGAKSVKMNLCYAQKEKKELIGGKT